jgi:hypothetical protein
MAAEVGGRLETVAPRRSLFGPDYVRLIGLLLIASSIHGWLITHTAVPARDSLGYARLALNLADPNKARPTESPRPRIEVIRTAEQPPGYPLAVWVTMKVLKTVGPVRHLPDPDLSLLATQVANAVAAVMLVVPLYLTGRILFGRNVGFAAALLFQVLPVPARVTSDGLSEGVFLMVVAVAILLGVRAARRPTIGGFLLCGLATGASYLVRPEGLLVAVAVTLVIVVAGVKRRWPRDVALGRLTALGVGVALVGLPYMVLIGKLTNKPTGDQILNPLEDPRGRIWLGQPGAQAPVVRGSALLGKWWNPTMDNGRSRVLWAFEATTSEVTKALHYVIAALAVVGLLAHRRQLFAPDVGLWVLVILSTLSFLLMVYLAARIGYVSERHTLLFVLIACIFAAAALEPLAELLSELPLLRGVLSTHVMAVGILVVLVAGTLPYTLKTLHPQREGHKHAGRWLAGHLQDSDWLVDPLTWAEWYAGRTLYRTVEYTGQPRVTWVIVEEGKTSPHSRLPQWEHALELISKGEKVYQWPEDATADQPRVCVYRISHPSPGPRPRGPKPD